MVKLCVVILMKPKPFAFIIINDFYILIHFINICIKIHCILLLQMQDLHDILQRARGAPTTRPRGSKRPHSVATVLPQRCHSALSNTLCERHVAAFILSMAFWAIA